MSHQEVSARRSKGQEMAQQDFSALVVMVAQHKLL